MSNKNIKYNGLEIAVIGMAGRFADAANVEEFWNNLKNGVESISFLSDEEIQESGVPAELLNNPAYVRCKGGVLKNKEYFDAQ
jgi:acyl transferase domain-containing protein